MQKAARNLADHGRIINISSARTSLIPPFASTYEGARAAMEAFPAVLAAELVPRGVSVNVVAPGAIETKMLRDLPKDFQEVLAQRIPLGIGKPRDIGGIVAYLAGDGGDWN